MGRFHSAFRTAEGARNPFRRCRHQRGHLRRAPWCVLHGGGEPEPIGLVEPIFRELAVEGGDVHAGPPGAGHFTKLVHNGIEFGMLQAIGEGFDLLEHHKDKLDIANVLRCWRHGSVIRSWLINLLEDAYRKEGGPDRIPPYVDDTGEVNWLVADAMRMEVPIPVIAESVMQLFASRDSTKVWARAIAMMRHGFGGHAYGESEAAYEERVKGRVEEISPELLPRKTRPPSRRRAEPDCVPADAAVFTR